MKMIIPIILLATINSFSQNCYILNAFNTFHGLKFGERISDSVIEVSLTDTANGVITHTITGLSLAVADILGHDITQYSDWFELGSRFDQIKFECTSNNNLFGIVLTKDTTSKIPFSVSPQNYPRFYKKVLSHVNLLFGDATSFDNKTVIEKHTIYYYLWTCDRMTINAGVSISKNEGRYYVIFTDVLLEKENQLERLKN